MAAELGTLSLLLALLFSILLVCIPTLGLRQANPVLIKTAGWYVHAQAGAIFIAFALLAWCFIQDDFSVIYVLRHSSTQLPFFYKLCAVWGGHEGSMLLWIALLSAWMVLVSWGSRVLEETLRARILVVLGALSIGFILFLLATSSPFLRQFQVLDTTGLDLNPLLQDPGFLFHPPMLYMGYVGFAVPFAVAIACLWAGQMDLTIVQWTRPWALASWCCLTLGVTLGSWWAYRELGWGGWWFWDPVENASFMPWLTGTALIHALILTAHKGIGKSWLVLLAVLTFSLSLIGTFLVRSGVLTSVHAFATDPMRGIYILLFLAVVMGFSYILFMFRSKRLHQTTPLPLAWYSREMIFFFQGAVLVVAMAIVLLGTLYPLGMDVMLGSKLSVGAPYFNKVLPPIFLILLPLMLLVFFIPWTQPSVPLKVEKKPFLLLMLAGLLPVAIFWLFYRLMFQLMGFLGLALGISLIIGGGYLCIRRLLWQKRRVHAGFMGMTLAHVGIGVTCLGITVSSLWGVSEEVLLQPGESYSFAGYTWTLQGERAIHAANYQGTQAEFSVSTAAKTVKIYPEKRLYNVGKVPMTEAGVQASIWRDLYIALGDPVEQGGWTVRLYYKPLVRWIWMGGVLMFLGGLCSIWHRLSVFRKKQ
ncbi:MAG: heme lyase CcmF/NrfE family subunit [Legionellaceae bacterium]|nr:heme lyase CcmF/NrfE family subunit [Legionellaceae bacterium]